MKFDENGNLVSNRVRRHKHVGIVGSSHAVENTSNVMFIVDIMKQYPSETVFVSGGAKGVDRLVALACKYLKRECKEYLPKSNDWIGFKARNLLIAKNSDEVVSVALPFKSQRCYHCNTDSHEKTAGCWTALKCKKHRVVILK